MNNSTQIPSSMSTKLLNDDGRLRYFDLELMTFLRDKKNDDLRRILEAYQPSDPSSTVYRVRDSFKATLLHYAAEYGNADIVLYLTSNQECEIDAQDKLGRTPILLAVMGDHTMVVDFLLQANASIHIEDFAGRSAMHMLLGYKSSRLTMIKYIFHDTTRQTIMKINLIENLRDYEFTLNEIATIGNAELVRLALDQGFYAIDDRNPKNGKTALHAAVELRNLEMVQILVARDADVDAFDASKSKAIWYLDCQPIEGDSLDECLEILKILLSRTMLLMSSNDRRMMQISNILFNGNKQAVELVLQRIDNYSKVDNRGNTVVHYAASNNDAEVIQTLRGRRFDVNARNIDGATALHFAISRRLLHSVKFLLENGAEFLDYAPLLIILHTFDEDSDLDETQESIRLLIEHGFDPFDDNLGSAFDFASQYYAEVIAEDLMQEPIKLLRVLEPVIALLSTKKSSKTEIIELVRSKIQLQPSWVKYLDMCEKQIDQMSKITIAGNVTLFRFLTESQTKITGFARNEELVSELKRFIEEFEANSPYPDMLQRRLIKAIRLAKLREKGIAAFCRLVRFKNNAHYFAAEYIVDYLSNEDMENLDCVWNV